MKKFILLFIKLYLPQKLPIKYLFSNLSASIMKTSSIYFTRNREIKERCLKSLLSHLRKTVEDRYLHFRLMMSSLQNCKI